MAWNCDEDNPTLRRRSRLKRTKPAATKPDKDEDDDGAYTAVVLALDRFPEAKRAVIAALRKRCGWSEEDDDFPPEPAA